MQPEAVKRTALLGAFIFDSVSMPVHWYYKVPDIKQNYDGWISQYETPKEKNPSSFLSSSNTSGAGRASDGEKRAPVVGRVILHDKLKYWSQPKDSSIHYHWGLKAGDSTLNLLCALEVGKSLVKTEAKETEDGSNIFPDLLRSYVTFMTTPGSHNDIYAESFHRNFFSDWDSDDSPTSSEKIMEFAEKRRDRKLAEEVDHDLASAGALTMSIPLIIYYASQPPETAVKLAIKLVRLTHCTDEMDPYIDLYAKLLHSVINGGDLREKVMEAFQNPLISKAGTTLTKVKEFSQQAASSVNQPESRLGVYQKAIAHFGMACPIQGAMISVLFLASEFHDDFEGGLLTNTNCGGENCHRGASLGALIAANLASKGKEIPQKWIDGLSSREIIKSLF